VIQSVALAVQRRGKFSLAFGFPRAQPGFSDAFKGRCFDQGLRALPLLPGVWDSLTPQLRLGAGRLPAGPQQHSLSSCALQQLGVALAVGQWGEQTEPTELGGLGFGEIHNVPLPAPLSSVRTCFIPVVFTKLMKTDYRGDIQRWITLSLSMLFTLHGLASPIFPPGHSRMHLSASVTHKHVCFLGPRR